ncbi:MAG: glycosyltransferase [Nostoc sp.]|uniref:glycosyltransferase n=1 Tax=Nostoc sp. TaxID=1180 RepID=UPI002FFADBF7
MGKKSIGILIYANPDHYPPTINAIHLLAEYFDVVLISRNQNLPFWEYPANVIVHRLGKYTSVREREQQSAGNKIWEYINFVEQARLLLKDVSLIYAYDAFGYVAAYLSHLMQTRSIILIYHNHDLNEQLFPLSSLSGWVQRVERKCVHKANLVVFPSDERAFLFKKLTNFNGKLLIVPNFPRKTYFKENPNFKNIISERLKKLTILLQGAISIKNSLLELIDSLTYLDNSIELKLIGPLQEEEKHLMKDLAIRNKVADRVKYFLPVPYNELPLHTWAASIGVCLYKKTDINHQTMGTASNKIYEYAACGLPVIVSDQPDYRENLGGEIWVRFADPDNPESIASAVKDILNNLEKYEEMCLAARQAFEEKYNYESAFSSLLTQIKDLVNCSLLAKD